jgi:ABC-type transport system involved in multi-copper enzyme maturation permease subunit
VSADTSSAELLHPLDDAPGGSLARSEARRFVHRRFIRLLVVLTFVGFLTGVSIAWVQHARTTPALLAQAQQRIQDDVDQQNMYRDQCLKEDVPQDMSPDEFCGPPVTAENFGGDLTYYLPKQPFPADPGIPDAATGIGFAVAAVMFLLGATWIGAEWSTRSMMALLFWEPRRMKVAAVKLGVLIGGVAIIAFAVQLLWLGAGFAIAATKGTTATSPHFWNDLVALQGRAVLLAVFSSVGGFALANLLRNTGAALGIGFVYFAILETAIRVLKPAWQEWLITDNTLALITRGGWRIYIYDQGSPFGGGNEREILLSNTHGATVLAVAVGVVLVAGIWSFKRRDLT